MALTILANYNDQSTTLFQRYLEKTDLCNRLQTILSWLIFEANCPKDDYPGSNGVGAAVPGANFQRQSSLGAVVSEELV